jgi:hypothetical protein
VLIVMRVNFKVKKDKHCAAIVSMEKSTMQDLPASIVKLVKEAVRQWERVLHAQVIFIKTSKAKQNASNAHWENCTSILKQHAIGAILEHTAVHLACVLTAPKILL